MTSAIWDKILPHVAESQRIPRIIHQTYPGHSLPEPLRDTVESLIASNPEWDHRLYDDKDIESFISEHFPLEILAAYRKIRPEYGAARADLFRYLAIYQSGGVYLDIKSRFTQPIDTVIAGDEGMILAQWRNRPGEVHEGFGLHPELAAIAGGEFQQWHVIARAGHPFLRTVICSVLSNIENYSPWRTGVGRNGVFRLTGPIAYTRAIYPLLGSAPARIVASEADLALEYSIAGNYVHQNAFRRHYSQFDKPVVHLPLTGRVSALVYRFARRLKMRLRNASVH